jgi:predicted amidohydrolase
MIEVASLQLEVTSGEPKAERVERVAREIEGLGGTDLVLLPEIWNVGYFNFDRYASEAEPLDGPTVARLGEAARAAGTWLFGGSIVEAAGGELFNTSVLLDRGGEVRASYRKIHLFGYGSREQELLSRGSAPTVADTDFGSIGLATCYDLRFPELFRAMVDEGAELFLVTSAWPYPRVEAWSMMNRVRAHENLAWLISANCAGGDPVPCCGRSMVVDPWGTPVAAAGDRATVVRAAIDVGAAAAARADFPALRDRIFETGRIR